MNSFLLGIYLEIESLYYRICTHSDLVDAARFFKVINTIFEGKENNFS